MRHVACELDHLGTGELLAVRQYWQARIRRRRRPEPEASAWLAAIEEEVARRRAG